ncbi:putative exopolysaccharide production protein precursor [Bradyrhizobium sp. ORS 375]|uniref:polysaccharide biosynthesis/export family protein n=1 Tax=Bradyrhizobium sp. (strain ORS 375) TaxID=566679 RepID=UPI000240598D|nr:polysaccharide biosynthesis/export family protein [Bradyrhizobium sp. ORS 375]CCD95835.1 putative exopolysaccharide production protein precursor [Bradyrhizobium sp. ORS 375]
MRPYQTRLRGLSFAAILVAGALHATPVWADYKISPGDVIDFSVAGVPDLKQKSAVDIDGNLTLPLAGTIAAAGLTLSDLRTKLAGVLSQREFRQRGYNKIERDVIGGDEIVVTIAEYRPVYVNGDVSKPGSQPYRPGLTVRQALSLAGGYDLLRSRIEDPILQSADLQGKYTTAWLDYAKGLARVRRLKLELGQAVENEDKELAAVPLPAAALSTIAQIENAQLRIDQTDHDMQRNHLVRLQDRLQESRNMMAQRSQSETEGMQADQDEYARIQDTFKKGLAPNTRMADARRIVLLSSIQSLQSAVELERAKTDLEKGSWEIGKVENARQAKLLRELGDANISLETLRSDIRVAGDKLSYVGMRKSLGRQGTTETKIKIVREGRSLASTLDTRLEPADVVDIVLSLDLDDRPVQ